MKDPVTRRERLVGLVTAATILAVTVGWVVLLLGRSGGAILGDETPAVRTTGTLEQMAPGDVVVQELTGSMDGLAGVELTFGTFAGSARCTLEVSLRADDGLPLQARGEMLGSRVVDCADLPDSSPVEVLDVPVVTGSQGERFDVVVERVDSGTTPGVVLWAGEAADAATAVVDGQATDLTAVARPVYEPRDRWSDHLGTVLARMAEYGPVWAQAGPFVASLAAVALLVALVPVVLHRPRLFLGLVVVLALVRGLVWSAVVPAFSGMDEPAHFANVQFMATQHELTGRADNDGLYSEQVQVATSELNLTATAPGDRPPFSADGVADTTAAIDAADTTGGGGGPAAAYPPVYYAPAALFYEVSGDGFFTKVLGVRLWSVALGVLGAVLLVLTGRRLFPASGVAQTAFAVAGVLQPMAAHQFAIVNNDAWVIVCGYGALLLSLHLADRPRAPWAALGAGAVIGAALLGKPFGIAVAVPLGLGWLIGKVRLRGWTTRGLLGEVALVVVGFLATYGLWRVVALLVDIPAQQVPAGDGGLRSRLAFVQAQIGVGGSTLELMWGSQFWGNFGWVRIPFPQPVPRLLFWGMVAIAVGMAVWSGAAVVRAAVRLLARRRTDRAVPAPAAAAGPDPVRGEALPVDVRLAIVGGLLLGIVGALYAAAWVYFVSTGQNDLLQGRYGLLALPAVLAAPSLLLERVRAPGWMVAGSQVLLAGGMLALMLLGVQDVMTAFYG